ncbi:MAG: zinc ABC transporter substrate-binding protein [Pyrinomonadaceae bacterium]|nr:zinc ABC transporter substrate-binding protein [Phycisphaerales bacterium]
MAPPARVHWRGFSRRLFLLFTLLVLIPACSRTSSTSGAAGGKITVVCTTGMIADAARIISGDRASVTALMGEGVDPHLYKASPGDIRALSNADLVLYNGLHLEGRMGEVLEELGKGKAVMAVGEAINPAKLRTPPEFEGQHDPHVWFDVSLWMSAVEQVRDALIKSDPAGKVIYETRAADYLGKLDELHDWCQEQILRVPESTRVLITAHDAFGYFGRAYGIEVRAIQGISTDSEAGLRDVNALVDLLVSRGIHAVFVESSVPRKTIDALVEGCKSRGHDVRVGGELFSDAMGKDGTPEGTYMGMVRHNVTTIVTALLGESK